jgi:PBP1b-binding outer membrane lipoprotein LpoB
MKTKLGMILVICGLAVVLGGCVKTMDGRTKMAVPFKKDKIEGRYQRTAPQVFEAAKAVLKRLGQVNSEDTINKTLTAKVDTRNVWAKVAEVDPQVTQVIVQVRTRGGGADIDLAAQIEKEIALALVDVK